MTRLVISAILIVGYVIFRIAHLRPWSSKFIEGGIYSIVSGKEGYGVVKLLVYESGICHVRIYKQKFQSRPDKIDPGSLSLGNFRELGDCGVGHVPLREKVYLEWQPVLITKTDVKPEELQGYEIWKDAKGGAF